MALKYSPFPAEPLFTSAQITLHMEDHTKLKKTEVNVKRPWRLFCSAPGKISQLLIMWYSTFHKKTIETI